VTRGIVIDIEILLCVYSWSYGPTWHQYCTT